MQSKRNPAIAGFPVLFGSWERSVAMRGKLKVTIVAAVATIALMCISFTAAVPALAATWNPVATGGFGVAANYRASAMAVYGYGSGSRLYVGTGNAAGCEAKSFNGVTWETIGTGGLGNLNNTEALSAAVFNSKLYAGTENTTDGCEVLRYEGGTTWTQVNTDGFGSGSSGVSSMAVFNNMLYAGTIKGGGFCVYRWNGSSPTWDTVTTNAFGHLNDTYAASMAVYDDGSGSKLYIGTYNSTGCSVYSYDGTTPSLVSTAGLGDSGNDWCLSLAVFNSKLYGGTRAAGSKGCDVMRYDGGTTWTQVNQEGFDLGVANQEVSSLCVYNSRLFAGTLNTSGCTVYSTDGSGTPLYSWTKEESAGFGNPDNRGARCMLTQSGLYLGTWNTVDGCDVQRIAGPPSISSITPSNGTKDTTVSVSDLAGAGFQSGAAVKITKAGQADIVATGITVLSWNQITCTLNLAGASAGAWDVVVTNQDSQSGTLAGGFTVTSLTYPTWYLAEGTTAWGFSTYISIENPNDSGVNAEITYMTGSGAVSGPSVYMPPLSQATVSPGDILGSQDFSTKVTCREGKTIAVDRTMTWTGTGAASEEAHNSVGVTSPAITWYLPEGSSNWGFECWLLIQNPNSSEATCNITYMVEGEAPFQALKKVPANSRRTFNAADDMGARDASIKVESNIPVIPERAMYRNNRREGHDSIGTTAPATDYFLAEGTTAWGFTTYVLVQNPQNTPTDVTVTYMTPQGPSIQPPFQMPANSRKTVRVNDILPNADLSTRVHGSQPIIAERAMYWDNGTGEACHDSIGMASAHTDFYLPDGQSSEGRETWTLVQNPNDSNVTVEVSYLTPNGAGNITKTETIPAGSRRTFNMAEHSGIQGRAAVMVRSLTPGQKIMVERAMYWNSRGAGTDTIGGYSD